MGINVSDDRVIASLETTLAGLTFSKDNNGIVRISDEFEIPGAVEQPSVLELTPPPTPAPERRGGERTRGIAPDLPIEIILSILDYVDRDDQETFARTSKVCRQWYFASAAYLYRFPKITGKNYNKFVATIAPSSTNIKPSPLASLVKRLDLSLIVHEGKISYTARLLRRTQNSLEEFIAPQASFGYACIVALGHCLKLRLLDLSLVSQSVPLDDLFRHIGGLPNLVILNFPRSSVYVTKRTNFTWPQKLERFSLSGSISDTFLRETQIPNSLYELRISHCPFAREDSIKRLLNTLSPQLRRLSISYHIPRIPFNGIDPILRICRNLEYLLVAVDYISPHFFEEFNTPPNCPLRRLDLESSGQMGLEKKIGPNDVFIAVGEDRLPALRIVRATKRLGWVAREKQDVVDLVEMLEAKRDEAGESGPAGVWEFDSEYTTR